MPKLGRSRSCFELSSDVDDSKLHFEVGNFLQLRLYLGSSKTPLLVKAEVIKCFLPFTQSQVMLVRLYDPAHDLDGQYALKLYSPRYLAYERQSRKSASWSPALDKEYRAFVLQRSYASTSFGSNTASSPTAKVDSAFSSPLSTTSSASSTASASMAVKDEIWYHKWCAQLYKTELEVYNRLHDLQGQDIPRFIARLEVPEHYSTKDRLAAQAETDMDLDPGCTKGVLLQHIANTFTLADLYAENPTPPPRAAFQYLGDEACNIINAIRQRGIRNNDVAPRNSLVCWSGLHGRYKVFVLDFGHCVIRGKEEEEDDWRFHQQRQDEEGAMGVILERNLERKRGGGFVYSHSEYTKKLDEEWGKAETPISPDYLV